MREIEVKSRDVSKLVLLKRVIAVNAANAIGADNICGVKAAGKN